MPARWPNKMSLTAPPTPAIIWHPFVEKSAFMGAVETSLICKGTWEEAYRPQSQLWTLQWPVNQL